MELHVTLWPSFPHFEESAFDDRLAGIRLNSAMMSGAELDSEIQTIQNLTRNSPWKPVPLWFDIKGRQLRVTAVQASKTHLELDLNHPIEVETPTVVLFKAGADRALLKEVKNKTHLIFEGGPTYNVKAGESLHIRHPSLKVLGPPFCDAELLKIRKVVDAGFQRYYLSYTEGQEEIDELRKFIGPDADLILKIENQKGLDFIQSRKFKLGKNTKLAAARGDLFVELNMPHDILNAVKTILKADPAAMVGSRLLLSMIHSPVPECNDLSDLAWLADIGYSHFLLCDELCLKGELLRRAINLFDAFRKDYQCGKKKVFPWGMW